jgi:hypothetical protein
MHENSGEVRRETDIAAAGRPWWQACCLGCLALLVAVGIGGYILLRVAVGPSVVRLSTLPEGYPKNLMPYRLEDAQAISLVSGAHKGNMMRILESPVRLLSRAFGSVSSSEPGTLERSRTALEGYASSLHSMDTLTIEWKEFSASPEEVKVYYTNLFQAAGLSLRTIHDEATATDFLLGQSPTAVVQIELHDTVAIPGIDGLIMTVDYITEKNISSS